ncbi:MAG: hypothetical protein GYA34_06170 [Chloroflexi bacterium]|nr:hypothetical protein [Chloroflexota bacterium]
MKKLIYVIALLILFCIAALPSYTRLVEIVIVNQSGMDIEISLSGNEEEEQYYLRIPVGTHDAPTEKTFEVVPDSYQATLHYVELWDPVYGYTCDSKSQSIDATRKVKITVFSCDKKIPKPGEYPIIKFGASGRLGRGHKPK